MADAKKDIAAIAADGVADGMHVIGEEVLAAEQVVRAFDGVRLAYLGMGVAIGAAVGGLISFNIAYRKAQTKFSRIADDEIAGMREHYRAKAIALDSEAQKTDLEEIVRERGYSTPEPAEPPMAVTPPTAVVDAAQDDSEPEIEVELVRSPEEDARNVFEDSPVIEEVWDVTEERSKRSPLTPYVIHRDERDEMEAYDEVTFTYYEEDDVLCNERDEVIDVADRERLVGEKNLERFGHGSGDANIVYIRNDTLEMKFEIVRSANSYAEEVHGLTHSDEPRRRRRVGNDDE